MESDFEVSIEGVASAETEPRRLPVNFISVGEIQNEDVKVYLHQDAYRGIEEFSTSDVARELGSILLGYESTEMGKQHVVISEFIEAKHADATVATLTFTHETWEYVHAEKDRLYPDSRIVGWHHTHPSYGVFLSEYDLFIQENYFDLPFQVAYVVDPVARKRAFFQWKNGNIERLGGFYVYDDLGKQIEVGDQAEAAGVEPRASRGLALPLLGVTIALLVVAALLSVWVFTVARDVSRLSSSQDELTRIVQEQHGVIRDQQAEIVGQRAKIDGMKKDLATATTTPRPANRRSKGTVTLRSYRVRRGETLTAICRYEWDRLSRQHSDHRGPEWTAQREHRLRGEHDPSAHP